MCMKPVWASSVPHYSISRTLVHVHSISSCTTDLYHLVGIITPHHNWNIQSFTCNRWSYRERKILSIHGLAGSINLTYEVDSTYSANWKVQFFNLLLHSFLLLNQTTHTRAATATNTKTPATRITAMLTTENIKTHKHTNTNLQ